ncbi:hypothetical protein COL35_04355 [Bacillus toyonensis]|uniref:hypothetical protein n=1 Tax=Bacillus toyonensis TaxID=155322 RepID=UPI000BF60275|nr:hypothetical protein [Bacillus toyonensis]PFX70302.1 hypothetical protein COL35_04355 [Bacillus toyonensis]
MKEHTGCKKDEKLKDEGRMPLKFEFEKGLVQPKTREEKLSEIIEWDKRARAMGQPIFEAVKLRNDMFTFSVESLNEMGKAFKDMANQSLLMMSEALNNMLSDIDWEAINQGLEEDARNLEKRLKKYEQYFWCLDMELVALIEDRELRFEKIPKYIEENLETYISEINKEPIYKFHNTLINEAYEAYKAGLYKLCTFPLFATLEYVMTSWYRGTINDDKQSINQTKYVKGLWSSIHPIKYKNVEEDPTFKVFSLSFIRVYRKMFNTRYTSSKLNRNTIAHGFHEYDSISKNDVLKLFQMLKAATILTVFDKNKLPMKKVAES